MVTVRKKFDSLQETSQRHTLNDKYYNFVNSYIEAAENIPIKPKAKCKIPCELIAARKMR